MEGPGLAVRRTISRILLGCLLALALAGLQTRSAQAVAGDLDPAFGEAGSFSTIVLGAFELIGRAVAVQPDGKIVVAAQLHGGIDDVDIVVYRLLPDGYPDGGFGGAVSDFSPLDIPADIAVQGDGKIVVVGTAVNGASAQGFVARFNANGTVDTGFGAGGKFIMPSGDPSSWNAVALQADGKIVVAGQVGDQFTVARFTAAGALDSGFDGDGLASAAIAGYSWAEDVAVNGEGKIVAVGGVDNDTSDYDVLVVSFNSDGSGNADFGLAGLFALDFSANSVDSARRLVIDGSGRIVVAGHFEDPFDYEHKAFLIRLASGGYLDPSFGDMGRVRLSADDGLIATGLQQDSLGRLVLAGYLDFEDDSWLARFSADGALDHGFGYDGLKVVSRGEDSCYFHGGLSLDSQDRPVCTGSTTGKLIVTRHQSDDHTYLWNNTWWWSDPERTDSYLVEADRVTIKAGATQDIWNCTRGQAPMFCRDLPGGYHWTVEATIQVPDLKQDTLAGLVLWNGGETGPAVHALYAGLTNLLGASKLTIQGSTPELCTRQWWSSANYPGQAIGVKIVRSGNHYTFYYSQIIDAWSQMDTITTTADFNKVGFLAKTWHATNDIEARFSNFVVSTPGAAPCLDLLLSP